MRFYKQYFSPFPLEHVDFSSVITATDPTLKERLLTIHKDGDTKALSIEFAALFKTMLTVSSESNKFAITEKLIVDWLENLKKLLTQHYVKSLIAKQTFFANVLFYYQKMFSIFLANPEKLTHFENFFHNLIREFLITCYSEFFAAFYEKHRSKVVAEILENGNKTNFFLSYDELYKIRSQFDTAILNCKSQDEDAFEKSWRDALFSFKVYADFVAQLCKQLNGKFHEYPIEFRMGDFFSSYVFADHYDACQKRADETFVKSIRDYAQSYAIGTESFYVSKEVPKIKKTLSELALEKEESIPLCAASTWSFWSDASDQSAGPPDVARTRSPSPV